MSRHPDLMAKAITANLQGNQIRLPGGGELAWRWFVDLCRTRSTGQAGPQPLTYAEIEAYARTHRWPFEPRHYDILFAMDRAFLDHAYAEIAASTGSAGRGAHPGRRPTLDAAAFDAVFG